MADETLPAQAMSAWQAYLDMQTSKDRHFECLTRLQDKSDAGIAPSLAEKAQLDQLLAAHDAEVKRFAGEMAQLRVADPQAAKALVAKMTEVSPGPTKH